MVLRMLNQLIYTNFTKPFSRLTAPLHKLFTFVKGVIGRMPIRTALMIVALGVSLTFAQGPGDGGPPPGAPGPDGMPPPSAERPQVRQDNTRRTLARLTTELKLTDDQREKVRTILEAQQKAFAGLRADSSTPVSERRVKAQKVRQESWNHIRLLLTPDQQKKFDGLVIRMNDRQRRVDQNERGDQREPPPPPPDGPPPPGI